MNPQRLTKQQKFVKHRYELACRRKAVARRDAKHETNMATLARIKREMEAMRRQRAIRAAIKPLQLPLPIPLEKIA